jgi:hypothetical protein
MRVCNKIKQKRILLLFLLFVLLVQTASALESTYYSGKTYYDLLWDDGYLRGKIEFAVYDNRSEYEGRTGLTAPGSGSYVYAYQIWNDQLNSDEAITYFAILGLDPANISGFGYDEDITGGIEPSVAHFVDDDGVWEWSDDGGAGGFIQLGDHSWLLVFSSEADWVVGDYEIRGIENDPFPKPDIPEPATVALLGAGGVLLLRRRRKTNL